MKGKIIAAAVVALAVFLAGFVPQFLEKRRLQTELENARTTLSVAQRQIEIDEIRLLAGRMLLEASRQNYGTSSEHSTEYFNKIQALIEKSDDPALKTALMELLKSRDLITSGLAQANASVISELQSLLLRTYNLPNALNVGR